MGQVAEGRNLLKRAIDITHEIALELIKHCQNENIDCIIAPYEADAQLAYLNISNIADVVITEDSDLTLFGCKKVSIFFHMYFIYISYIFIYVCVCVFIISNLFFVYNYYNDMRIKIYSNIQ